MTRAHKRDTAQRQKLKDAAGRKRGASKRTKLQRRPGCLWADLKVGFDNLIGTDGEGFLLVDALWSLLLPQREPPTEDVNPSHGREGCQFIVQCSSILNSTRATCWMVNAL